MAVYLFTYHGYRTWRPDNPRGYVKPGTGILDLDEKMAQCYGSQAQQKPTLFKQDHQKILIWTAHDACHRRQWQLHYIATETTHVHVLVSWREFMPWEEVSKRLKNLMSLMLGRKLDAPGGKWFSRKGSRKRVQDKQHFDYLVGHYLPSHRGLRWREGDTPPVEPFF